MNRKKTAAADSSLPERQTKGQGMEYQDIFKRYELKYRMTKEQKEALLERLKGRIAKDRFFQSTICNIYFDTPDRYLIRRSLEKPVYKEKLRIRSYGPAVPEKEIFVELKKKYDGVVYKRRISLPEKTAMEYLVNGKPLKQQTQIGNEIDYFLRFYPNLAPSVYLSYDREAYSDIEDPAIRITFDENILWREDKLSLCSAPAGNPILEKDEVLMELKIAGSIPLWLVRIFAELHIERTTFSKYGNAYMQIEGKKKGKKYA